MSEDLVQFLREKVLVPGHIITNPQTGNTYVIENYLGSGAFGSVYRVKHRDPQTQTESSFAMKVIPLLSSSSRDNFREEVTAYHLLSSTPSCQPYIVCLYDSFIITYPDMDLPPLGIMVSELMDSDLEDAALDDNEIVPLLFHLLSGLHFIHSHGFAHRDLKPGNILTRKTRRHGRIFKIGDLGLLCDSNLGIPPCFYYGDIRYLSPEGVRFSKQPISVKQAQQSDIWSLGITLFDLIFGYYPFPDDDIDSTIEYLSTLTSDQLVAIINEETPYPRHLPDNRGKEIIYLLTRMLQVNPNNRWSTQQLLDYFKNYIAPPSQKPIDIPLSFRPRFLKWKASPKIKSNYSFF